jgi:hypothetical protein
MNSFRFHIRTAPASEPFLLAGSSMEVVPARDDS